jgi:hypothetical protein
VFRLLLTAPLLGGAMRLLLKLMGVFLFFCLPAIAGEHWNQGKVLQYQRNIFSSGTPSNEIGHTAYTVKIDAGDRIYLVERTLNFVWQKAPALAENGPVEWRLKGTAMVVRDDKGKEFTVTILQMQLKE